MKILMATMGLDIGGAETHILELSKELHRRGHDVIVASNGGVYVPELEQTGIRHFAVPMNKRDVRLMVKSFGMMEKIIKDEKPDIVHAHARIPAFICGLLQKKMRFPFVTTAHWVFNTGGALRFLTNWGDRTISVSDDIKEYLKVNYGVPDEHIFVTINGIDIEKFSPDISGEKIRREFDIEEGTPIISHVSRLDTGRELAAAKLIEAAPEIAANVPGAVILIAGGGDVFDELSARAEAVNETVGYKCVRMAGARTDINEIIAAGDIFVGVSRATLEAMASAKPVVIAGNEGYMGLFTPDKLEKSLDGNFCCRGCGQTGANKLAADVIAAMKMTPEEKAAAGEYGRSVILKYYSVERMAADAEKAYGSILNAKRVVMSGYYGFSNAGDEAILDAVLESVRRSVPEADVTVLSKSPRETAETYGCKTAGRFDPIAVCRAIKTCDLLISGGGSLLQDTTSTRSLLYYVSIIRLAELMGKRVMLYANGIGPVRKPLNRKIVARAAQRADVITLRDEDSLAELDDMLVTKPVMEVTADPVYLLDPAPKQDVEATLEAAGIGKERYIAVSVRQWAGMDELAPKLAEVCDGLYEKYGKPALFVSMQAETDGAAAKKVMAYMKSPAYEISGMPRVLMGVIGKAEIMLSIRLHSVIFAARMGVPVAGVNYDPKVESALEMLSMPNLGTVKSFDAAEALCRVSELYETRGEKGGMLEVKRTELRRIAEKNEQYVREILK